MYTDCPDCSRQFRIYAVQLTAAKGQVKCGYCGRQFNALERLHDRPLASTSEKIPVITEENQQQEPRFEIPDYAGDKPAAGPTAEEPPPPQEPEPDELQAFADPGTAKQEPFRQHAEVENYNFPGELLIEEPPKSSLMTKLLWGSAIFLLLLIIIVQVIWFNRDTILSRYPDLIPWADKICAQIQCERIRHRDVSAIKIINRDVREHPRYKQALLVNATMSNQLHTRQPFPVVQLNLFNTDGKVIGSRKFQPREYLDNSINITEGMRPDVPVHFVLEVTGGIEGAVSFEFEFL